MALMVQCPQHQHGAIPGFYGSYAIPISSTTRLPSSISLSIFRASCRSRAASALVRGQKLELRASNRKSRLEASLFPFLRNDEEIAVVKEELLEAIRPLDRGAEAIPDDESRIDKIANKLESMNRTKEPLKSPLLNGKWELLYTTSKSILKKERPKFLRPNGSIYQAINADTLRAQNMETWPYFNQVTANLTPINQRRVGVKFDKFKVFGLISINAPGRARGELEITYLDEDLRISRGDKGNLFILRMVDPSYIIPN